MVDFNSMISQVFGQTKTQWAQVPLKYPEALFLIIPIFFLLAYFVRKNFVKFDDKEDAKKYRKQVRKLRSFVFLSRMIIFTLLVIALASPFHHSLKEIRGEPTIRVLNDVSDSMSLYKKNIGKDLKEKLESHIPTSLEKVGEGMKSNLGDNLLGSLNSGDTLLVVSDGNVNHGRDLHDILLLASQLNATIHGITLTPNQDDTSVTLEGSSTAIIGTDIEIPILVQQVGVEKAYSLTLEVDGSIVMSQQAEGSQQFSWKGNFGEGHHTLKASIVSDDFFSENNVFYKTVQVLPKPDVYVWTNKDSPVYGELAKLYDITKTSVFPNDPSQYAAIIVDDMHSDSITTDHIDQLTEFITDGGGLFFVGGTNSFDFGEYKDSYLETILPVQSGKGKKLPDKKASIVIVIDVSGSTGSGSAGFGGEKKVDIEKALAVKVLDYVSDADKVAVVAFNTAGKVISPLSHLAPKKDTLIKDISKLKDGGGTDVEAGIKQAELLLVGASGSRNIILISDGNTRNEQGAYSRITSARFAGVKLYTVGVGDDTSEKFMLTAANIGGGTYFKPDQSQHLRILFGDPEVNEDAGNNLVVLDAHHFITHELELQAELGGFNQVVPKASATNLITTGSGDPILNTWRFGLGRVATLATDDGTAWAGQVLGGGNAKLLTRSLNWVIGDVSRLAGYGVQAKDTYVKEKTEVLLRSKTIPVSPSIEFSKVDHELYQGHYTPGEPGFFSVMDAVIGVNHAREYERVGMNPALSSLVKASGGEFFEASDVDAIVEATTTASRRKETQAVSLRWPFLIAALLVFLFEVFIRRVKEIKL
jgi:uncharacterized membrane protein